MKSIVMVALLVSFQSIAHEKVASSDNAIGTKENDIWLSRIDYTKIDGTKVGVSNVPPIIKDDKAKGQHRIHISNQPWQKKLIDSPLEYFKDDISKSFKLYKDAIKPFEECVNQSRWPQMKKCLDFLPIKDLPRRPDHEQFETSEMEYYCFPGYQSYSDMHRCLSEKPQVFDMLRKCLLKPTALVFIYPLDASGKRKNSNELIEAEHNPSQSIEAGCQFGIKDGKISFIDVNQEYIGYSDDFVLYENIIEEPTSKKK